MEFSTPIGPGSRLDAYEIVAALGSGGMGQVWLARDLTLNRHVAIKVLPPDLTQDPSRVTRFQQEARAASALNHPNVCTIFGLGETPDGQRFIAMEFVEGQTLRDRFRGPRSTLREDLDIATQIASALTAAHASGIVHRDIKPENVMLRPDGFVKVLDFGLAKLAPLGPERAGADATHTVVRTDAGTVVGTVAYMSPEQARGQPVDARTDVWSLGVLLYEMVAGRSPFAGQSSSEMLAAILQREPAPLARFEPETPQELQRIVGKALRKDREQRYQSMKDLLLDLQALREGVAGQARGSGVDIQSLPRLATPTPTPAPAVVSTPRLRSSAESVAREPDHDDLSRTLVPQPAAVSRLGAARVLVLATVLGLVIAAVLYLRPAAPLISQPERPVVVMMDSMVPERVYDPVTRQNGGTNADDINDILRDLPLNLSKEATSAAWHREDQIARQNPALLIAHLSSFAKSTGKHDNQLEAQERMRVFLGFLGVANPRTRFIVYSRGFATQEERKAWIDDLVQRFPALQGRVWMLHIPGGGERASFRDPATRRLVKDQVTAVLENLPSAVKSER